MTNKPTLSPRAIAAYNRLQQNLAALNYLIRVAKPSGQFGETGRRSLNHVLRSAIRLFRREPLLPRLTLIDPAAPLTVADVVLLVSLLTTASLAFETRYQHLTKRPDPDFD